MVYLPHQQHLVRRRPMVEWALTSDLLFRRTGGLGPSRWRGCTGRLAGLESRGGKQTCWAVVLDVGWVG